MIFNVGFSSVIQNKLDVGGGILVEYILKDQKEDLNGYEELVQVHPDRIIKQSQLRYGNPDEGESGFVQGTGSKVSLRKWETSGCLCTRLIIDPPKQEKPQTALATWKAECPSCDPEIKAWVLRMPEEE